MFYVADKVEFHYDVTPLVNDIIIAITKIAIVVSFHYHILLPFFIPHFI